MKKLSIKMKLLLVIAICVGMMAPTAVNAWSNWGSGTPSCGWGGAIFCKEYTPGKWSADVPFSKFKNNLNFTVMNGSNGKNLVSSVRIVVTDEDGNVVAVPISPDEFNQNEFSTAQGTIGADQVAKLKGSLKMDIKVGGPKNSVIKLIVK